MSTKKNTQASNNNFEELLKDIKNSDAFEIEVVRDLVSEQIYNAMSLQKISKAELARKLKTSAPYITKLLQGNGNFTIETFVKIAKALGCKFRPMFVPMNHSWRVVVEYADSANFQPNEHRITQRNNFKPKKLVDVDLGSCDITTEETNNERVEHITG